jgi:hypothetical protein
MDSPQLTNAAGTRILWLLNSLLTIGHYDSKTARLQLM